MDDRRSLHRAPLEGTEGEENQRPYEPEEEQQFEPLTPTGSAARDRDLPADPAGGKQPSGAPPASAEPLGDA